MRRILGESIRQEANILCKGIKNVRITENAIIAESEEYSITIPITTEEASKLKDEDVQGYIYKLLLNDILEELGTVVTREIRAVNRYGTNYNISDILSMVANNIVEFPSEIPSGTAGILTKEALDNYLYASAVTRLKFIQEGHINPNSHMNLLGEEYYMRRHYGNSATRQGRARDIAFDLDGYLYGADPNSDRIKATGGADLAFLTIARIEGINIVNVLYGQLVKDGFIEPFDEPRSTEDKFEAILQQERKKHGLAKYLDSIIEDAQKIHGLTPDEIAEISGSEYTNTRVSLAISNHYLDNIEMLRAGLPGQFIFGQLEDERDLARSQRARELVQLRAQKAELTDYSDALDEIQNIELYGDNLRKIQSRMITGLTAEQEGNIEIDEEMYATTAIGRKKINQEDAVLLVKDEDVPGLKMMIVADGMGGMYNGVIASHMVVNKIKEWFEGLSKEQKEHFYSNIADIQQELNRIISECSSEIDNELLGKGEATIVCSIIGENETIITNVGDSRAYLVADRQLKQVSIDDTYGQATYEAGNLPSKDAMRFYRFNDVASSVGKEFKEIHSSVISNDDYDMILLFSDGVTDCLSEEEIAVITRQTDKSKLSQELVRKAVENLSRAPREITTDMRYMGGPFDLTIPGGKDNTTAAVYIKDEEADKGNDEER